MNRKKKSEYQRLLENLRAIARDEEKDWEEADWRRAVLRATASPPEDVRPARRPLPGWAWAYAAGLVVLLGAAAVVTRSFFREAWPTLDARVETSLSAGPTLAGAAGGRTPQDRLAVSFVSGESGLRVYWYFDKEFEWEEKP